MFRSRTFLLIVPTLIVMAMLPLGVGGYILGLLTLAYYYAVFAMSWDLLFGFAGEVNFGPSFLIGIGAYAAALLNHYYNVPIPGCLVAGALAALLAGVVLAVPALRLTGPYFGLVTLVAVDTRTSAQSWRVETSVSWASAPTVADDRLYLSAADGRLLAIDTVHGALLGQTKARLGGKQGSLADVLPAPLTAGNHIYATAPDGSLFAVDGRDPSGW